MRMFIQYTVNMKSPIWCNYPHTFKPSAQNKTDPDLAITQFIDYDRRPLEMTSSRQ